MSQNLSSFEILGELLKGCPNGSIPVCDAGEYFYVSDLPRLNVKKYRSYMKDGCLVMESKTRTIIFGNGLVAAQHYFLPEDVTTADVVDTGTLKRLRKYHRLASETREIDAIVIQFCHSLDYVLEYRRILGSCIVRIDEEFVLEGLTDEDETASNTYVFRTLSGNELEITLEHLQGERRSVYLRFGLGGTEHITSDFFSPEEVYERLLKLGVCKKEKKIDLLCSTQKFFSSEKELRPSAKERYFRERDEGELNEDSYLYPEHIPKDPALFAVRLITDGFMREYLM